MIKNQNIICISSIDWDFIWQGHQEIMSTFAKNGNQVFFIENTGVRIPGIGDIPRITKRIKNWFVGVRGIRKEAENLYVFSPVVLPFPYSRIAVRINRRAILSTLEKWCKIMNFSNPVIWVFLPTPLSLDIIDNLNARIVIYYCIDNFRVSSAAAKKIKNSEIKLLKKADLVFVTSKELYNYCNSFNKNAHFFPFAVNFREFEKVNLQKHSFVEELSNIKEPIVGYIGGIHRWLDLKLIKAAAEKYRDYAFVFIGPIQRDISFLSNLKNIYFLEKKGHGQIPHFIKNFAVCIIPYLVTDYTRNVYPTKLNEYHAMGKPVVSTDLPEIAEYNHQNNNLVFVGKNHEEFLDSIRKALDSREDKELIRQRILAAENNSWDKRIEEMSGLIENVLTEKKNIVLDWRKMLIKTYKNWRKKVLRTVIIILTAYLLIFYAPLVWFLAKPLKISQTPQQGDCIVVFAGGVGESGRAGQGYEERVKYAVELYKKKYANKIIFSSGATYVFQEPAVMKAVAISLGIPENSIILEDKAKGTYENVKFSKEILDSHGWNKILLISSPYHMRRVMFVFGKIAKNIKVTYAPLPNSLFYSHPAKDISGRKIWKRINLQQINGILHEYLGILYYWWKGYI